MWKTCLHSQRHLLFAPVALSLLFARPVPAAQTNGNSCANVINACGCVITKPGTYTAANDLSATQTTQPNCIEIAIGGAILNLKGVKVLGNDNGTGIGVLIRRGANGVIVEGGDEANNTPPQNPVGSPPSSPSQAKVNLWNIGIEDDGDDAIIALFSDVGGSLLQAANPQEPTGNSSAGIFLNAVNGSFVGDFNANFNGKYGVVVKNSTNVTLANFTAAKNHDTGLVLDSSNNNSIGPAGASSNTDNGIMLLSSSGNTIHDSNGNSFNGNAGIVFACASGDSCAGADGSNQNLIINAGAPQNGVAGIVINFGSQNNAVTITHNQNNGGPSDLIDLNPGCDSNTWYNNVGSANQSCIH